MENGKPRDTSERSTCPRQRDEVCVIAIDALPVDILESGRGVLWNFEVRAGKSTKVPYQAHRPALKAAVNNPATWAPFADAVAAYEDGKADGVGIVLGDGLVGVDLDHCRDPETGAIAPWAQTIIAAIDSYTESSPSGTGVHILLRGESPIRGGRKKGPIELYADGRYFTVTGQHLAGTPTTIETRTVELAGLLASVFGTNGKETQPAASTTASVPFMITRRMRASLSAAGYTEAEINAMTPAEAHAHLQVG